MADKGIAWVIIGIIVMIIVIMGLVLYYGRSIDNNTGDGDNTGGTIGNVVEITSNGFNSNILEITQGETVNFINNDNTRHWPASGVHPTHRIYPGSGIEKCGTAQENTIFDACRGLSQGESYSFIFNEKGRWNYHDHLNPSMTGVIVVN